MPSSRPHGDPVWERCAHCGHRFEQRQGPGRRRKFCKSLCERRAQRERARRRKTSGLVASAGEEEHWADDVAEELRALVCHLVRAQRSGAPLSVLLRYADEVRADAACYAAAAVHDARQDGAAWEQVSEAAGVSVDTAQRRWSPHRVLRALTRRSRGRRLDDRPPARDVPACRTRGRLPAALSVLQGRSGKPLREAAQAAGVSASYVSRVLAGKRIPQWPVVNTLTLAWGGDPAELRALWELDPDLGAPPRRSAAQAAARLQAALRGLYLASGQEDTDRLAQRAGVDGDQVRQMLSGDLVGDWPMTAALIDALQANPLDLKHLWEEVYSALLRDCYPYPSEGHRFPPGQMDDGK